MEIAWGTSSPPTTHSTKRGSMVSTSKHLTSLEGTRLTRSSSVYSLNQPPLHPKLKLRSLV